MSRTRLQFPGSPSVIVSDPLLRPRDPSDSAKTELIEDVEQLRRLVAARPAPPVRHATTAELWREVNRGSTRRGWIVAVVLALLGAALGAWWAIPGGTAAEGPRELAPHRP